MYLMCAADRMLVKVGGKFVISADTPALCRRHTARFEEFTYNLYYCNLPKLFQQTISVVLFKSTNDSNIKFPVCS